MLKPVMLDGNDMLRQLNRVKNSISGKHLENRKRKRTPEELNWTKKSIFLTTLLANTKATA